MKSAAIGRLGCLWRWPVSHRGAVSACVLPGGLSPALAAFGQLGPQGGLLRFPGRGGRSGCGLSPEEREHPLRPGGCCGASTSPAAGREGASPFWSTATAPSTRRPPACTMTTTAAGASTSSAATSEAHGESEGRFIGFAAFEDGGLPGLAGGTGPPLSRGLHSPARLFHGRGHGAAHGRPLPGEREVHGGGQRLSGRAGPSCGALWAPSCRRSRLPPVFAWVDLAETDVRPALPESPHPLCPRAGGPQGPL